MIEPFDLPLDDRQRLVSLPLLDSFNSEQMPGGYSIIFIPSEGVSPEEKEMIFISADSPEGRLLVPLVQRIDRLSEMAVERIIHSGGANYTLIPPAGDSRELDDESFDPKIAQWVFETLKHMAQIAECAFVVANSSPGRVA